MISVKIKLPLCTALLLLTVLHVYAQQEGTKTGEPVVEDQPAANPGRPTVSSPATLTPVGYLQFETGTLSAWNSPGVSSQTGLNEVVKFSPLSWLELLVGSQPVAHSRIDRSSSNATGGTSLGFQTVVHQCEKTDPTVAVSYFHQVYGGNAPDLDIASATNSVLILASADVKGFHYDTNAIFGEVVGSNIRRAPFGQTLSVSHPLTKNTGISGEIWHFTQPFLRGNAVGNLWALSYTARNDLVFDGGFDRGLTSTSAHWEVFAGFTYLLPHKLLRR